VRETTAEGGGGAGTVAGRFALIRKLGEGGMGVVYEAEDLERGARVALKVLHRARAGTVARFKREFRSLQHLEHPNLVRLGELITDGHEWCFTMELVEGVSLLEHVRGERPFAEHTTRGSPGVRRSPRSLHPSPADRFHEGRLRDSLRQLALALATLHAAGIVHRDVKPSNILVTGEGRLIVLDLGLALDLRQEATPSTTGTIVGTVAYMAPERAPVRGPERQASARRRFPAAGPDEQAAHHPAAAASLVARGAGRPRRAVHGAAADGSGGAAG
jgi:serine/threonine protein kinase